MINLMHGDSLEILKSFDSNSIDSIVTDPPYGIGFMGKSWDKVLPPTEIWQECLRVLKPGGYLVAMSASRTYHRLAVQLEDLGMICHPMIGWIYGSGFPKATDLSKQFDKGVEREVVGYDNYKARPNKQGYAKITSSIKTKGNAGHKDNGATITIPSTELARKWSGYKYGLQALKPALEPIAVFQKPWKCKGVKKMTENIIKHGVGAFNIDACRARVEGSDPNHRKPSVDFNYNETNTYSGGRNGRPIENLSPQGRHPANLLHDGSDVVEEVFLEQGGIRHAPGTSGGGKTFGSKTDQTAVKSKTESYTDSGSASRFFNKLPITDLDAPFLYTAKPSKRERNAGLEGMEIRESKQTYGDGFNSATKLDPNMHTEESVSNRKGNQNNHPTVKPIKLMEWLVRLVTPEGGVILDPFMGSGTTGIAAKEFNFIGIEMSEEYFEIAKKRIYGD